MVKSIVFCQSKTVVPDSVFWHVKWWPILTSGKPSGNFWQCQKLRTEIPTKWLLLWQVCIQQECRRVHQKEMQTWASLKPPAAAKKCPFYSSSVVEWIGYRLRRVCNVLWRQRPWLRPRITSPPIKAWYGITPYGSQRDISQAPFFN